MSFYISLGSLYFQWLKFKNGLTINKFFSQYIVFVGISPQEYPVFTLCICLCILFSLCLFHCCSASAFPLFLRFLLYCFLNVAVTRWQQPPTSSKGASFFLFFFSLRLAASALWRGLVFTAPVLFYRPSRCGQSSAARTGNQMVSWLRCSMPG